MKLYQLYILYYISESPLFFKKKWLSGYYGLVSCSVTVRHTMLPLEGGRPV